MISLAPHTNALRALALIVGQPGHYDAERVGQALWRPRLTGTAGYLEVRNAIKAGARDWTHEAGVLFGELQRAGLIEKCRPPMVAEEWAEEAAEDPIAVVRLAAVDSEAYRPDFSLRAHLLARLIRYAPATVAEWVGDRPAGNVQRAKNDLIAWGVVVPRSCRWPTEAGVAIVDAQRAA